MAERAPSRLEAMLRFLESAGEVNLEQIVEGTGMHRWSAREVLLALRRNGELLVREEFAGTHYSLAEFPRRCPDEVVKSALRSRHPLELVWRNQQ